MLGRKTAAAMPLFLVNYGDGNLDPQEPHHLAATRTKGRFILPPTYRSRTYTSRDYVSGRQLQRQRAPSVALQRFPQGDCVTLQLSNGIP